MNFKTAVLQMRSKERDFYKIRSYREREMLGNTFRKPKAYGDLLSDKIEYPFIR